MKKKAVTTGTANKPSGKPKEPASIVIHDLADAIAALRAAALLGQPVTLWSAAGAGIYSGASWFAAIERRARGAVPAARARFILDCAERADMVQEAFRTGITDVCFNGTSTVASKLSDIAGKSRASLHRRRPKALDLASVNDAETACLQYLGSD